MSYFKTMDSKMLTGLILVGIGALLLLRNLGIFIFTIPHYIFEWEGIIIIIGIILLKSKNHKNTGIIFIGLGVIGFIPNFWPLLLILGGVYILLKNNDGNLKRFIPHSDEQSENNEDMVNDISIFGGGKKYFSSKTFKGGSVLAVFGGSEIDLLNCTLAEGKHTLEVIMIFGGASILIPDDWNIQIDLVPVFGGFSDKRRHEQTSQNDDNKVLIIKGIALFGGGEIKN